jgi:hypothetical protein
VQKVQQVAIFFRGELNLHVFHLSSACHHLAVIDERQYA